MREARVYNMTFRSGDEDHLGVMLDESAGMVGGKNSRRECQNSLARVGVLATNYEA